MNFDQYLQECQQWAENSLKQALKHSDIHHPQLSDAIYYSTLDGGKRIRPLLVRAACEALGGTPEQAASAACALEMVHTYSLVHDDLPAMDDDDLRRGKPTSHKMFGEAAAILTGDALLTLAFEVISRNSLLSPATLIQQVQVLAKAAGANGMVSGQMMDMDATGNTLSLDELKKLHEHKTGALIEAACTLGGLAAGGNSTDICNLQTYAKATGLAFQVQDDILDVTADTQTLGKPQGSDIDQGKNTYVSLLGLAQAQQQALDLRDQAISALESFGQEADPLRELADYIVTRKH